MGSLIAPSIPSPTVITEAPEAEIEETEEELEAEAEADRLEVIKQRLAAEGNRRGVSALQIPKAVGTGVGLSTNG